MKTLEELKQEMDDELAAGAADYAAWVNHNEKLKELER